MEFSKVKAEQSQWNTKVLLLPQRRIASSNKTIKIWEIRSNDKLLLRKELKGHSGFIFDMIYLGSNFLASCGSDRTIRIWNTLDGLCVKMIKGNRVFGKLDVISMDKCLFVSACNDGFVKIWNWISGKSMKSFNNNRPVFSVLSLNSNHIVCGLHGNPCEIKVWNITSGICVKTLKHGKGRLYTLEKIDDDRFVSGCEDGTIKLWDLSQNEEEEEEEERVIIDQLDEDVAMVRRRSNNFVRTFEGHSDMILSLKKFFSPNYFISCQKGFKSSNGIKLWSTRTGDCLKTYEYHCKGFVCLESYSQIKERKERNEKIRERINSGDIHTQSIRVHFMNNNNSNNNNNDNDDDPNRLWIIPRSLLTNSGNDLRLVNNNQDLYVNLSYNQEQQEQQEQQDQQEVFKDLECFESAEKIDYQELQEGFMTCLFGEDNIEKEYLYFDLYELFVLLQMKGHAISILQRICHMKTNDLLFVFIKSLLKYEREKIKNHNFSPQQNNNSLDVNNSSYSSSTNISDLLNIENEEEGEDDDEEEDEQDQIINSYINNNNIIPPPPPVFQNHRVHNNVGFSTRNNNNQMQTIRRRRRKKTTTTITTTTTTVNLKPLPFKKTSFNCPFSFVCFRELKKRKIEISRNPKYLEHLEKIGILKNIFFFREDMMASLSTSNSFISNLIHIFDTELEDNHQHQQQQNENNNNNENITPKNNNSRILTFEELFRKRLSILYQDQNEEEEKLQLHNLLLRTKDGGNFKVHKEILMTRSSFFCQMFSFDGLESSGKEVMIEYLTKSQLEIYLNWIYLGRIDNIISSNNEQQQQQQQTIIMIDEEEDNDDDDILNNKDKDRSVLPLVELYRHCEMYFERDLQFLIRCELISNLNKFGCPNSCSGLTEGHFSPYYDFDGNEDTEIEQLLLRIGHIFMTLPNYGEDIFKCTDWVSKKKIGSYRSIRTLIRCSSRVQDVADKLKSMDRNCKELKMEVNEYKDKLRCVEDNGSSRKRFRDIGTESRISNNIDDDVDDDFFSDNVSEPKRRKLNT